MKNRKVIIAIIITAIICVSGTTFAVTQLTADKIYYTDKNNNEITVATALDQLYNSVGIDINANQVLFDENYGTQLQYRSNSISVTKGKYLVVAIYSRGVSGKYGSGVVSNQYKGQLTCLSDDCEITELKNRDYSLNGNKATLFHTSALFMVEVNNDNDTIKYDTENGNNDGNNPEAAEVYIVPLN